MRPTGSKQKWNGVTNESEVDVFVSLPLSLCMWESIHFQKQKSLMAKLKLRGSRISSSIRLAKLDTESSLNKTSSIIYIYYSYFT